MLHNADDIACLGKVLAQELHTGRRVVKDIPDDHCRSLRAAGIFILCDFSGFQV